MSDVQGEPSRSAGFLRDTGIVTVAGIAAGFLQYAFHWYAARNLLPSAYGDVSALLSLVFMVGLPASVIQTAVAKGIAELSAQARFDLARDVLRRTVRALLCPAVVAGGALSWGSTLLAPRLQVESVWVVAVTGPVVALLILLPLWRGAVQGLRNFVSLGLSQVVEGVARFAACAVLVSLGAGAVGAMGSSVAAIAAGILTIVPALQPLRAAARADASSAFREVRDFLPPVALALSCFAVVSNADVMLVKALFPPAAANDYAAAAVLGRSVLYISVAVTTVMLPLVAQEAARHRRSRNVLLQSFAMSGLLCGACAAVLATCPRGVAVGVFGENYAHLGPLVRWYSLAMIAMVPLNTLINYELGRGHTAFLRVLAPGAVLHLVALRLLRQSLHMVLVVVAASGVANSLLVAGFMLRQRRGATFHESSQAPLQ